MRPSLAQIVGKTAEKLKQAKVPVELSEAEKAMSRLFTGTSDAERVEAFKALVAAVKE